MSVFPKTYHLYTRVGHENPAEIGGRVSGSKSDSTRPEEKTWSAIDGRLIPLYQTLIRSILDYGSPIYSLAPKSQLAQLDPIQNSAIRICTGAVRTSPHLSLCSDSGMPALRYRALSLSATLISSIRCLPTTFQYETKT